MWPRRFVIYTGRRSNGCLTGNILIISSRIRLQTSCAGSAI
ncbi:hypothetical protein BMETH_1966_0 [methanotrophic bacterial endosymbiont of Bathymodiolus sp.]|nr:hypothetical protein BMETH_1966_0 [methanotrophic bacterial endosymbiont of Bathymodiolus sp.]